MAGKRKIPDDFDVAFRELGRVELESRYEAGRKTITRWLEESGKERLLSDRRKFIRAKRANDRDRELRELPSKPQPAEIHDNRQIDPKLAEMAARHLQRPKNGGWVAYRCEDNPDHFMVGILRLSAAQMLDKAKARGFDERRALHQIKVFREGGR